MLRHLAGPLAPPDNDPVRVTNSWLGQKPGWGTSCRPNHGVSTRTGSYRLLRTIDEIVVAPGRHGTTLLRAALDIWLAPIAPGSPAEARLLRRLRERGYGGFEPQFQVVVDGRTYYLDVAWPQRRCALEYAGADFHGPRRWPRDERRSAAIVAAGWDLYEVDAVDVLPSRRRLWEWLDTRFRPAA